MKNIENILDNEYMTDEYIDQEIIVDNDDGHNLARKAHEIWNIVIENDNDTEDVGDSIWPQILNQLQEEIHNGLDEEDAIEIREIIWENYVPEWESYL